MDNCQPPLAQVDKLADKLSGFRRFLGVVNACMDALQLESTDDPLYLRICDVREGVRLLLDELVRVRHQNISRLTERGSSRTTRPIRICSNASTRPW